MTASTRVRTGAPTISNTKTTSTSRSIKMQTMHEALARERMRESEHRAWEASLVKELVAQRRWHRVTRYAQAAENRHARRASQVAVQ
jgi:hypothetical protein